MATTRPGTRPNTSVTAVVADARLVASKAREHFKAFAAADKGKTKKALPRSFVDALAADADALEAAVGGQSSKKGAVASATSAEVAARAAVREAVRSIRDDVANSFAEDAPLRRAFGVGARLSAGSTPLLLSAATNIAASFAVAANANKAKQAGVTSARVKKLAALGAALAAADTTQGANIGARRGATRSLDTLIRNVKSATAHVRKVAKAVFRADKATLAEFQPVTVRRTPKPRAKKPPPPVAVPPAPPLPDPADAPDDAAGPAASAMLATARRAQRAK